MLLDPISDRRAPFLPPFFKQIFDLPATIALKLKSDWKVTKKSLENMRETLQKHIEGSRQVERARRVKECFTKKFGILG